MNKGRKEEGRKEGILPGSKEIGEMEEMKEEKKKEGREGRIKKGRKLEYELLSFSNWFISLS